MPRVRARTADAVRWRERAGGLKWGLAAAAALAFVTSFGGGDAIRDADHDAGATSKRSAKVAPAVGTAAAADRQERLESGPSAVNVHYLDGSLAPSATELAKTASLQASFADTGIGELAGEANPIYMALLEGLRTYQNEWSVLPQISLGNSPVEVGDQGTEVANLFQRLGLAPASDGRFNDTLAKKIAEFQEIHGLPVTGMADAATIAALNRGSAHYEAIIRANLERARRISAKTDGKFVLVNTAAADLIAFEEGQPALRMKVALGSTDRPTVALADRIETIVVNPPWNLPPHLVQSMIAPEVVREGIGYLEENGYVVLSDWSDDAVAADPASVDWQAVSEGKAFARVRQNPGATNPMGRAKFMFPNHLGIYLHDTPARDVFARSARYVSNGCVRLERADDLANFLSSSDLVFGDAEQPTRRVVLAQPVPVFIMHFTFWAEGKTLSFHNDVYHKDQPLLDAVQIEGMPGIS